MSCAEINKGEVVDLLSCLTPLQILFVQSTTKDAVLNEMAGHLAGAGTITKEKKFYKALSDREALGSTGVGHGIAIPHAKLAGVDDFFLSIGIHSTGIQWDSFDGVDVRLIFMIGGPVAEPIRYLKILSNLTRRVKNEKIKTQLLACLTPEAVINVFEKSESTYGS